MEHVDAAEHPVRCRERDPLEQPSRPIPPKAAHAAIADREPEGFLVDRARRAADVEEREVGALVELDERAHELARITADAGCVRNRGQVVDADAQRSLERPRDLQAGNPFFATRSIAALKRSISSSVVYTAGETRRPWNSCTPS
jgi:hypothetical protein